MRVYRQEAKIKGLKPVGLCAPQMRLLSARERATLAGVSRYMSANYSEKNVPTFCLALTAVWALMFEPTVLRHGRVTRHHRGSKVRRC